MQSLQVTTHKKFCLAVSAVFIVVEHPSWFRNNTLHLPSHQQHIGVCSFDGGDKVGLEHSYFPSERRISSSSHQWRVFSLCQPKFQMKAEGAIPRIKQRRNIIFTGKGKISLWVQSHQKESLFSTQYRCSLSHQLRNDCIVEKVFIFRPVGSRSLSW